MEETLLDLPFDHYERHIITREVAEQTRHHLNRPSLRVLDVGGGAASLARFLPHDDVTTVDLESAIPSERGYVIGSGTNLPFRDGCFDVTACHDTLEHVPANRRNEFLHEMARVASGIIIVQGPFSHSAVEDAERAVMALAGQICGADCSTVGFLTEHAEFGLPDLNETTGQLEELGFGLAISVPNGRLSEWVIKMLVKHHASKLSDLGVRAHEFDRWSNNVFLPGGDEEPTYRHAIIASRSSDERLLRLIEERFRVSPAELREEDRVNVPLSAIRPALATFANLTYDRLSELTAERQLDAKERAQLRAAVARLEVSVRDREDVLTRQENILEEREEHLNDLARQLEAIRSSSGYRLLNRYRSATRAIFPPNSVRGAPYRMVMTAGNATTRLPGRLYRLARRGFRAQQRYGTAGVISKGIGRAGRGRPFDVIKYALDVDWHAEVEQPTRVRPRSADQPVTINWVIPTISEGGGLRTIFRFVHYFNAIGYHQRVYEMPVGRSVRSSADEVRALIHRNYKVVLKDVSIDFDEMEPADFAIATSWHTAYAVVKSHNVRHKMYFVQDFEPSFAPTGTESILAENTYRFGLHGITAGGWLAQRLSHEYGMVCDQFQLAVDPAVYYPLSERPLRKVFYYARPATPRRGYELGIATLAAFKSRHPEYEIVLAGGELPEGETPFPSTVLGYLSEEQLNTLYNECAAALVISLTNCSLLPLEIMATGCPVVTNVGANNEKIMPPDSAVLAEPTPARLAAALEQAVQTTDRDRLVKLATGATWEDQTESVARVLGQMIA